VQGRAPQQPGPAPQLNPPSPLTAGPCASPSRRSGYQVAAEAPHTTISLPARQQTNALGMGEPGGALTVVCLRYPPTAPQVPRQLRGRTYTDPGASDTPAPARRKMVSALTIAVTAMKKQKKSLTRSRTTNSASRPEWSTRHPHDERKEYPAPPGLGRAPPGRRDHPNSLVEKKAAK